MTTAADPRHRACLLAIAGLVATVGWLLAVPGSVPEAGLALALAAAALAALAHHAGALSAAPVTLAWTGVTTRAA